MIINMDFLESWNYTKPLPIEVRTEDVINNYNIFKNELKLNNIKIEDYILHKFLKSNDASQPYKNYTLELNTFPYNTPKNMKHYVLWVHPNYRDTITNKEINDIIIQKMNQLGYNEYFCFENNIACKSVLGLLHYQVFFNLC